MTIRGSVWSGQDPVDDVSVIAENIQNVGISYDTSGPLGIFEISIPEGEAIPHHIHLHKSGYKDAYWGPVSPEMGSLELTKNSFPWWILAAGAVLYYLAKK